MAPSRTLTGDGHAADDARDNQADEQLRYAMMKCSNQTVVDAYIRHADELPPTTLLKVCVCDVNMLPEPFRTAVSDVHGGFCDEPTHFIWLRPQANSATLLTNFWHELGHYFDFHRKCWFSQFIQGADTGSIDWEALKSDYAPEKIEGEKRAWLFAQKLNARDALIRIIEGDNAPPEKDRAVAQLAKLDAGISTG